MHHFFLFTFLFIFCLIGVGSLAIFQTSFIRLGSFQVSLLLDQSSKKFFFIKILSKFFPTSKRENIHLLLTITKDFFLILLFFISYYFFYTYTHLAINDFTFSFLALGSLGFVLLWDLFCRLLGTLFPKPLLHFTSFIVSIYLILLFPLTYIFLFIIRLIWKHESKKEKENLPFYVKEKVLQMIKESDLGKVLSSADEKLIASFLTFREKVVREIMIPRVDVFSLSRKTSIQEAAKIFVSEDYSRVPVYGEKEDDIVGILHFKDLLKTIASKEEEPDLLNNTIETLIKPVIYVPENKKISLLFQEFRLKKTHIAIVVNEYGALEGIITIEDILEELVGEIEDEFDISEQRQYWEMPDGSFVVDAKMSINDIEEKLHIYVPHNPEYETIGGYLFFAAGTIPQKGFTLHKDTFNLEVLIATERSVEKIRITPIKAK